MTYIRRRGTNVVVSGLSDTLRDARFAIRSWTRERSFTFTAGPAIVATSVPDYFDRRREIRSFAEQALYRRASLTLGLPDGVERVNAIRGTPSFYRLLGTTAYAGRVIVEEDGELGNAARVVLSYTFWQRRYGTVAVMLCGGLCAP
jgi:hypothetical protein